MTKKLGAITIAEGKYSYKTDVTLALSSHEQEVKTYVLRTSLDSFAV